MKNSLFGFLILFFFVNSFAYAHNGIHHDEVSTVKLNGESIYNLNSKWTNQDGKTIDLSSLKGEPVVLAMLYTHCKDACPMTVSNMKDIESNLPEKLRSKVRFAIFSFDTDRDTPTALRDFAQKRALDLSHWSLFNGTTSSVRKLAAVLGIKFKKEKNGDFDHSNAITLLDDAGVIVFQQMGLTNHSKELVSKLIPLIK